MTGGAGVKIKVKMKLLSDTIFGNGMSVPGEEDISVQTDGHGFPYYKGGTFKGVFREELIRFLDWTMTPEERAASSPEGKADRLLGSPGDDRVINDRKIVFSDFELSPAVRREVINELGDDPDAVLGALSETRTFTKISEEGVAEKGSLRIARCVHKDLIFYSTVECSEQDRKLVEEVLEFIKWIGSMRNRGFGKVKISVEEDK